MEEKGNKFFSFVGYVVIVVALKLIFTHLMPPNPNTVITPKEKISMVDDCVSSIERSSTKFFGITKEKADCYCRRILNDVRTIGDAQRLSSNLTSGNIEQYMPSLKACGIDMDIKNNITPPVENQTLTVEEKRAMISGCKLNCKEGSKGYGISSASIEKFCDCQCTTFFETIHTQKDAYELLRKSKQYDEAIEKIGIQCVYKIPELRTMMEK